MEVVVVLWLVFWAAVEIIVEVVIAEVVIAEVVAVEVEVTTVEVEVEVGGVVEEAEVDVEKIDQQTANEFTRHDGGVQGYTMDRTEDHGNAYLGCGWL